MVQILDRKLWPRSLTNWARGGHNAVQISDRNAVQNLDRVWAPAIKIILAGAEARSRFWTALRSEIWTAFCPPRANFLRPRGTILRSRNWAVLRPSSGEFLGPWGAGFYCPPLWAVRPGMGRGRAALRTVLGARCSIGSLGVPRAPRRSRGGSRRGCGARVGSGGTYHGQRAVLIEKRRSSRGPLVLPRNSYAQQNKLWSFVSLCLVGLVFESWQTSPAANGTKTLCNARALPVFRPHCGPKAGPRTS